MYSGRRTGAANGSTAVFSTLLNTMNTLLRGNGVMLSPEPARPTTRSSRTSCAKTRAEPVHLEDGADLPGPGLHDRPLVGPDRGVADQPFQLAPAQAGVSGAR